MGKPFLEGGRRDKRDGNSSIAFYFIPGRWCEDVSSERDKNFYRPTSSLQYCCLCWFGWLVGFLTSSSTTRLYRGPAPRQSVWQFYVLPHMRQSWETMTSISAGHIILTPTQPVGSGRPQRGSNPGPPDQESRALPTELPRPPCLCWMWLILCLPCMNNKHDAILIWFKFWLLFLFFVMFEYEIMSKIWVIRMNSNNRPVWILWFYTTQ